MIVLGNGVQKMVLLFVIPPTKLWLVGGLCFIACRKTPKLQTLEIQGKALSD